MFRKSQVSRAVHVPTRFTQASDIVTTFPRFSIGTHVSSMLPELKDAREDLLLPKANIDAAIPKLSRAEEVFGNMPSNAFIEKERRAIAAAKCLALKHYEPGQTELPSSAQRHTNADLVILQDISKTLAVDDWDRKDIGVFDSTCVLLGAYVQSVATLLHAMTVAGGEADAKKLPESIMPLDAALKLCSELEAAAADFSKAAPDAENAISIRIAQDRLLGLQALLTMAATGDIRVAKGLMKEAGTRAASRLLSEESSSEVGLFFTLHTQLCERAAGYSWGAHALDDETYASMYSVLDNYHNQLRDPDNRRDPNGDIAITMEGMQEFRDHYSLALVGIAQTLQKVPRPLQDGVDELGKEKIVTEEIFPRYLMGTGLVETLPCPKRPETDKVMRDRSVKRELDAQYSKKIPSRYLERALKINRALYPEDRKNPTAVIILRSLASHYAEMRDYLYASGLFQTADEACCVAFGEHSYQRLEILHLKEAFQARMGSTNEAAVTNQQKMDVRGNIAKKTSLV